MAQGWPCADRPGLGEWHWDGHVLIDQDQANMKWHMGDHVLIDRDQASGTGMAMC